MNTPPAVLRDSTTFYDHANDDAGAGRRADTYGASNAHQDRTHRRMFDMAGVDRSIAALKAEIAAVLAWEVAEEIEAMR